MVGDWIENLEVKPNANDYMPLDNRFRCKQEGPWLFVAKGKKKFIRAFYIPPEYCRAEFKVFSNVVIGGGQGGQIIAIWLGTLSDWMDRVL
jgi:hypothetical protein